MTLEENIKKAERLASLVGEKGGVCYYVGGFVRDRIMQNPCKDIDIEVHGIYPEELEKILDSLGERISIGESFGIYSLKGCDIDIAMPRRERVTGRGHRDFSVTVNPFIGTEKAASRRDFTINSLMQNVLTDEITDHFGGIEDIKSKTLRYVNANSFTEDALRVFRAAQFCARFNFKTDEKTIALCRKIDVSSLSKERIEGEMKKALLKAEKPSVFFETLRSFNQLLPWFSELYDLIGTEQRKEFHLEGDVWNHTMMVLDEAAKMRTKAEHPYEFMLSALCHDFGKAVSTKTENGIIRSIGHEKAGIPVVKKFLSRITNDKKVTGYVLNMTELHMLPNILAFQNSSVKATNKLFDRSVSPSDLILLSLADDSGRITEVKTKISANFLFERLAVFKEYMSRPFVTGKDLIDAGLIPDENFSDILSYAHKLRLSGTEKSTALKQCLKYRKTDKSTLRKEIKTNLDSLSEAYLEDAGVKIGENVISSDFFKKSRSVFIYMSMKNEPPANKIIEIALRENKRVFVPKTKADGQMKAVEITSSTVFSPGLFGIPEPENGEEYTDDFDIAVIPCVSVSRNGDRLGHGKGYYDRFLKNKKMKKICLCFEKLMRDFIPADENDVKMDIIVTENEIISL